MKFGTCLFLEIEMALQAREVDKSWFHLSLLSCCCCWFKNLKVLAQSQKFSQQLLNEKSPLLLSSSKLIPLQTLIKTSLYCLLLSFIETVRNLKYISIVSLSAGNYNCFIRLTSYGIIPPGQVKPVEPNPFLSNELLGRVSHSSVSVSSESSLF